MKWHLKFFETPDPLVRNIHKDHKIEIFFTFVKFLLSKLRGFLFTFVVIGVGSDAS